MIALGGNALSPKGEAGTIYQQFSHTRESLDAIMHFVNLEYNICLTHGNGPQVGDELYRMELTYSNIPPLPLGVCVAQTQGSIGYMVQQSLQNALKEHQIEREVVTLITQTIVDADDPSIKNPTKFIGQCYTKAEAENMAQNRILIEKMSAPNLYPVKIHIFCTFFCFKIPVFIIVFSQGIL